MKWFLLFFVLPLVELWLLITIGEHLGATPTVALVLVTGLAGVTLVKRQGRATLQTLQQRLARGEVPSQQIAEGALLLFSGAFLMTPGVITDATGLLLLVPPLRAWCAKRLVGHFGKHVKHVRMAPPVGADGFGPIYQADARVLTPEEVAARDEQRRQAEETEGPDKALPSPEE